MAGARDASMCTKNPQELLAEETCLGAEWRTCVWDFFVFLGGGGGGEDELGPCRLPWELSNLWGLQVGGIDGGTFCVAKSNKRL